MIRLLRRFVRFLTVFPLLLLIGGVGFLFAWGGVKERYVEPWVGTQLTRQVEKRLGWQLSYTRLSTNLFTTTTLHQLRLQPRHPKWALLADRLTLRYTLWDLLRKRVHRMETEGCRLVLGKTELALSVSQNGELLTLGLSPQRVPLQDIQFLPKPVTGFGTVEASGEALLKTYKPHLMQLRLKGKNLKFKSRAKWEATTDAMLVWDGPASSPSLKGRLKIREGKWRSGGTFGKGAPFNLRQVEWMKFLNRLPGTVHLDLPGENFWIQADPLRAKVRSTLSIHKAPGKEGYLLGHLEVIHGTYRVREYRFDIRKGVLRFQADAGKSPHLEALLETRVKRYRIFARVEGTLDESVFHLSSAPELSHEDILSLLAFGKRYEQLKPEDRLQLVREDATIQILDLFFLGRTERLASKLLGVDEINVEVNTETSGEVQQGSIKSVEVGKYLVPDRLFGSYKLEPPAIPTEPTTHALDTDYQLSETFSVGVTVKKETPAQQTENTETDPHSETGREEALVHFRWKF